MRGPAPNQNWLTMRNIVQQALSIPRATATERCNRYTPEECQAILDAADEPATVEAIAAAEDGASKRMQGHVEKVHAEAQKKKPKAEKKETKPAPAESNEAPAETKEPVSETPEAKPKRAPRKKKEPKPVVKTRRNSS